MIPHSSFYSEIRKTSIQGGSIAVRLPANFAKSLEALNEVNLKMLNINNSYIVYLAEKMSHNDLYDLLQIALTLLECIYHNTDREDAKQNIEKAYELLASLQLFSF